MTETMPYVSRPLQVFEDTYTAEDAMRKAKLDWTVSSLPIYSERDFAVPIPKYRAIVRDDNSEPLGVVSNRYVPVQNKDCFSFFDNIIGGGDASYVNAGAYEGGARVFIQAKHRLTGNVNHLYRDGMPDNQECFITLMNYHNGGGALKAFFTSVRLACSNAISRMLRGDVNRVSVYHTANAEHKMREGQIIMEMSVMYFQELLDKQQTLARRAMSLRDFEHFVENLFPETDAEKGWKAEKQKKACLEAFEQEETIYGADWFTGLNAITGVIDHSEVVAGKGDRRVESNWFGSGMKKKNEALEYALA